MFFDLIMSTIFALFLVAIVTPVVYITHKIVTHTKRPFKLIKQESMPFAPTMQEDPRTIESIRRTRKTFEAQWTEMSARALKAHSPECPDPWTCTKENCFKFEPDKIVKQSE